ncbi:MAG: membrane dipeptidase [Oscillospiraceae bacterium]|jgi:membrane dipeptidase|nr:membrane dipeptidase [Oscillospiraceae bacterium]
MNLFDLHCDTLTRCVKKGEALANAGGHVSLARGMCLERWGQVFAVFVPDTLRGQAAADYAGHGLDFYDSQRRMAERVCTPVLAVENGSALGGDIGRLDEYAARGVRILTLTWNGANELGHGAHCGPAPGLTDFGKAAVRRMFKLGIVPDVSHLNEAGFRDVAALAAEHGKPFWATHSNCAAVRAHPRNLSDWQLREIFAAGGLAGVTLFTEFLGGAGTALDAARHLEHMLELGGEGHAALGSDFDGCEVHPSLAGLEKLEVLDSELERFGFTREQRGKFFWSNAAQRLLA